MRFDGADSGEDDFGCNGVRQLLKIMKTKRQQQIEIVFCAALAMVIGISIGYYYAAATAAAMMREGLK